MTLVTPHIVNSVSCVKRINDECYFSWQAQYLVKFKCHFSWQAQKCCIFQYKLLVVGAKSNLGCEAGCGRTVSCSDHSRIMLGSAAHWK